MCGPAALCQALAKAKWLTLTQPVRNERCNVWVCLSRWPIKGKRCHVEIQFFHCWKCTVVWKARWPGTKTSTSLLWWLINYDMSSLWERGASMHIAPLHLNEIKKRVPQLLHAETKINQLGAHAKLEFAAVCSNSARVMSVCITPIWKRKHVHTMWNMHRCKMWTAEKLLLVCTSFPESWWIIRFHADDSSSLLRTASRDSSLGLNRAFESTISLSRRRCHENHPVLSGPGWKVFAVKKLAIWICS